MVDYISTKAQIVRTERALAEHEARVAKGLVVLAELASAWKENSLKEQRDLEDKIHELDQVLLDNGFPSAKPLVQYSPVTPEPKSARRVPLQDLAVGTRIQLQPAGIIYRTEGFSSKVGKGRTRYLRAEESKMRYERAVTREVFLVDEEA